MAESEENHQTASLYGLKHSNRNFSEPIYWGKNQFNSSFPMALCCYMRDTGRTAMSIRMKRDLTTAIEECSFEEVFGTTLPNQDIYFQFESYFSPFKPLVADSLEKIDVVISESETRRELRPLEIKLTTLPDDGTSSFSEDKYGSEIVVRSPTMRYMALSMIETNHVSLSKIRELFSPVCRTVDNWENITEMKSRQNDFFSTLKVFLRSYCHTQKPLLIQPIWKTIGKSPVLAQQCLDVFVWTDFALVRLILDSLEEDEPGKISRPQRAAIRLVRFLYEASRGEAVYQKPIYDGMTYDTLNDKEFAVSGRKTNQYMSCPRLMNPIVSKDEIKHIVLGGGQRYLSPERRFDSILFFSRDIFDE